MANEEPIPSAPARTLPPNPKNFARIQRSELIGLGVPSEKIAGLFSKSSVTHAVEAAKLSQQLLSLMSRDEAYELLLSIADSSTTLEERLEKLAVHGIICKPASNAHLNDLVWGALWLLRPDVTEANEEFVQSQRQQLLELGASPELVEELFQAATVTHAVEAFKAVGQLMENHPAHSFRYTAIQSVQAESSDRRKAERLNGLGIRCSVSHVDLVLAGIGVVVNAQNVEHESRQMFAETQRQLLAQQGFTSEQISRLFNKTGITHAVEAAELAQAAQARRGPEGAVSLLERIMAIPHSRKAEKIRLLKQAGIECREGAQPRIKRLLAGALSLLDVPDDRPATADELAQLLKAYGSSK